MIHFKLVNTAIWLCLCVSLPAQSLSLSEPNFDRWMYINNASPGNRGVASTFSALPSSTTDENRLAQFIVGFDTNAPGTPTPDWQQVQILSVRVTATNVDGNAFRYDQTYDPFVTYLASTPDSDSGRPIAIHGTGFRNDYSATTFLENSPHGSGAPYGRNAFALSFDEAGAPVDVSHNVTAQFESNPWAIGQTDLAPGTLVPFDTQFEFNIDLTQPEIESYVRSSLVAGQLFFTLSSLHAATQQGGEFVNFYTRDSTEQLIFGDVAPTLVIEFTDAPLPELPTLTITHLALNHTTGMVDIGWNQHALQTYTVQGSRDLQAWKDLTISNADSDGTGSYSADPNSEFHYFRVVRQSQS